MTSAWTNAYYFLFSYTPLPTALMFGAFTASVTAARAWSRSPSRARAFSALAGALLGASFWSSPSAAPLVALLGCATLALHAPRELRRGGVLLAWQSAGFALVFAPLVRLSLEAYLDHVANNIDTSHYADALARFGHVPRAPFGTLARVLATHAPIEAALAAVATVGIAIALLRRSNRASSNESLDVASALRVCAVAAAVCVLHAAAIDALPTTKLGRTHFHVYPLVVLVLTVGARAAIDALSLRRFFAIAHGAALALTVALSLWATSARRARRFSVPSHLAAMGGARVYVLRDDPHREFLSTWLDDRHAVTVEASTLDAMISSQRARGERGALVVGPTGEGSGRSVMQHGTLRDFRPRLPSSLGGASMTVGYYGFDPAFLMEEEICEALLFTRRMPRVGSPSTRLRVFVW